MTRELVMAITRIEALHLSQMTEQFRDLLAATTDASSDDAVARLVPEGYLDDAAAAREFRRLPERELLARRHTCARRYPPCRSHPTTRRSRRRSSCTQAQLM